MTDTLLNQFIDVYQRLDKDNLNSLRVIYSDDVTFEDSLHKVEGIDPLISYFESQYKNLNSCRFVIKEAHRQHENAWLVWDMSFSHRQLKRGAEITVNGASHLRMQNKVTYHRDYVDMDKMLYEHLPLIGPAIRLIKRRAIR